MPMQETHDYSIRMQSTGFVDQWVNWLQIKKKLISTTSSHLILRPLGAAGAWKLLRPRAWVQSDYRIS